MNHTSPNADLNNSLPETFEEIEFYPDHWAEENGMLYVVEYSANGIRWFETEEAYYWADVQNEVDQEYMYLYEFSYWWSDSESEDDDYDYPQYEGPYSPHYAPSPAYSAAEIYDSLSEFLPLGSAESDGMPHTITLDNSGWGHGEEGSSLLSRWASRFVASLERVELSAVPSDKSICPICWMELGETYEFHELYEPPALPSDPREAGNMVAFQQLPFDLSRPNNDPVKLPCEHIFGYDCLVNSLSENTTCPMCRRELR